MTDFEYDIVISYAGEDRAFVEPIIDILKAAPDTKVFYDNDEIAKLWGKTGTEVLPEIYGKKSKLCLMVISEHYAAKQFPTIESRAAFARATSQDEVYVLAVRLDDTELPGLDPTIFFLDGHKTETDEIAKATLAVLADFNDNDNSQIVLVSKVMKQAGVGSDEGLFREESYHTTCPTCKTEQSLDRCAVNRLHGETVYTCTEGCQSLVVVGKPRGVAWPGRGYRLKDYVIRNASDLILRLPGAVDLVINASPKALATPK